MPDTTVPTETVPLTQVLTADQFRTLAMPSFSIEADFTDQNNEDRTLADYLGDVAAFCERALAGEIEFRADALPCDAQHQRYADYLDARDD